MTVVPFDRLAPGSVPDGPVVSIPLRPDAEPDRAPAGPDAFAHAVSGALAAASGALGRADAAEHAFAAHRGGLAEMVLDRARADVMLSLASAATSRAVQSLSTILGMQV